MAAWRLSRLQQQILHWLAADQQRTRGMIVSSHEDLVKALPADKGNRRTVCSMVSPRDLASGYLCRQAPGEVALRGLRTERRTHHQKRGRARKLWRGLVGVGLLTPVCDSSSIPPLNAIDHRIGEV